MRSGELLNQLIAQRVDEILAAGTDGEALDHRQEEFFKTLDQEKRKTAEAVIADMELKAVEECELVYKEAFYDGVQFCVKVMSRGKI